MSMRFFSTLHAAAAAAILVAGCVGAPARVDSRPSPADAPRTLRTPSSLAASTARVDARSSHENEPLFHTFSIAAVDRETGETGVAVTTRVVCVGNAVPWVRAGVGAVATQAFTRMQYGPELLDLLEQGVAPEEALRQRVAADDGRDRRQVGVIALDGRSAQHTGPGTNAWAGHRAGVDFVTQGNLLVGAEVLDAVARSFEGTRGSGRALADRLTEALEAGQATGGDARVGRLQSAALLVADPRPGVATRDDHISVNINICEHAEPVAELRRQYESVSGTLGFRTLEQHTGSDVAQLKIMLHALGYYRADQPELDRGPELQRYTADAIVAVDRFRDDRGLTTGTAGTPAGWVDRALVDALWAALQEAGKAAEVRKMVREMTVIRR
jgi:uncharacterized Ntn-hydrolase superfamily protein